MSRKFIATRRFVVEVSRDIEAENFGDAEDKITALKFSAFLKTTPGTDLCDYGAETGMWISEAQE